MSEKSLSKQEIKKRELAVHTLSVLSDMGYASASLRDIASEAGVSLGVIHYYFEDKIDLICYCVSIYKERFIDQILASVDSENPPNRIIDDFLSVLMESIEQDAKTHRLWYDIRGQAMFDDKFKFVVNDIENRLTLMFQHIRAELGIKRYSAAELYAMFDGLFRFALHRYLMGDGFAIRNFETVATKLLQALTAPEAPSAVNVEALQS